MSIVMFDNVSRHMVDAGLANKASYLVGVYIPPKSRVEEKMYLSIVRTARGKQVTNNSTSITKVLLCHKHKWQIVGLGTP